MRDDIFLQSFLELGKDWPLSLIKINEHKNSTIFSSRHLFEIVFFENIEGDFLSWRHHRIFNDWQDDIFWMSDEKFQFNWPLIASALVEHDDKP